MIEHVKTVAETVAATTTIGTIMGFLPLILGIPAAIFYCFKIWETDTVRGWRGLEPKNDK